MAMTVARALISSSVHRERERLPTIETDRNLPITLRLHDLSVGVKLNSILGKVDYFWDKYFPQFGISTFPKSFLGKVVKRIWDK